MRRSDMAEVKGFRLSRIAAVIAVGVALSACGTSRQSGVCGDANPAPTATGDVDALDKQGDEAFAARGDKAQAEAAIKAWTEALKVAPSRPDLRVKLARASYYLADSVLWMEFNIDGNEAAGERMVDLYKNAANEAELALGQKYPGFRSKYCARQPFNTALEQLDKEAVPAMYWYAASLSRWALMTSIVEVLNQTDRIKAMMELIRRLDPSYWYYAADRYLGGFYTKIPFPNGNLVESSKHFDKAIQGAPNYLATKVIYAEMNAAKGGDRALFQRLLDEVIAFDLSTAPEIQPENAGEQKKAKFYLDDIDTLVNTK
jgi:tetratricopeptide (TPR) repeat protein